MQKFSSLLPPGLTTINGKRYVCPGWIEVPLDTTLEDVMKNWTKKLPPPAPGMYCSNQDIEDFLSGNYKPKKIILQDDAEFKVLASNGVKEYTVRLKNNIWSCDCVGFSFRNKCKHVESSKKLNDENK